jgi:hypothetical protein
MEDRMNEIEQAIETYRGELVAEADLARADLREIEDHLRALIDDLRATGMPAGDAIAEAARRLGDPKQVAREHARVRTPFGARLSRVRTWSAVALLAPSLLMMWRAVGNVGLGSSYGVTTLLATLVLVALAARLTWARPIVMATLAHAVIWDAAFVLAVQPTAGNALIGAAAAGALVFVVPWRRGELTGSGWALALLAIAYSGAGLMNAMEMTNARGGIMANPATYAWLAIIIASGGVLLRARWAALFTLGASLALGGAVAMSWSLEWNFPHAALYHALVTGTALAGIAGSLAATWLAWRNARSALGTLHGVLS